MILLKELFHGFRYFDLLKGEVFERLNRRPELLREELLACEENELNKRIMGEMEVYPAQEFLYELWKGSIIQ